MLYACVILISHRSSVHSRRLTFAIVYNTYSLMQRCLVTSCTVSGAECTDDCRRRRLTHSLTTYVHCHSCLRCHSVGFLNTVPEQATNCTVVGDGTGDKTTQGLTDKHWARLWVHCRSKLWCNDAEPVIKGGQVIRAGTNEGTLAQQVSKV